MYWDYYILGIILLPGLILGIIAQSKVSYNYSKYSKVMSKKGYTGSQVARAILDSAKLFDYKVEKIGGQLTDNFNPRTKIVSLSSEVYDGTSVASLGIACHEVGHALQYANNYAPIKIRNAMIKTGNITNTLLWPIIIIGLILNISVNSTYGLIFMYAGVIFFGLTAFIDLVTLPVEYNASARAKRILINSEICDEDEMEGVNKVLNSAALTYVAALVVSILNLVRFLLLFARRDD